MKCPYRVQVNRTITTSGSIRTVNEKVNYEDCYEEDCPFYNPYTEDCGRAIQEMGGEL